VAEGLQRYDLDRVLPRSQSASDEGGILPGGKRLVDSQTCRNRQIHLTAPGSAPRVGDLEARKEAMRTALDLGHQFLFRATQDRKIRRGPEPTDKTAYLKRLARSLPASVSSTVEVPGRGGRPARTHGCNWRQPRSGSRSRRSGRPVIPSGDRSRCGSSGSGSPSRLRGSRSRWSGSCLARCRCRPRRNCSPGRRGMSAAP